MQGSSRCILDITVKLSIIQGAAPYDIAIAGVLELYLKDILRNSAIGYCRVAAGKDSDLELYPEDILRNPEVYATG